MEAKKVGSKVGGASLLPFGVDSFLIMYLFLILTQWALEDRGNSQKQPLTASKVLKMKNIQQEEDQRQQKLNKEKY